MTDEVIGGRVDHHVKDLKLAEKGRLRIEWAGAEMPVLRLIEQRYAKQKPLRGVRLSACLHVTSETANLMRTLKVGGATVAVCASNPLSTQDDVAASLVQHLGVSPSERTDLVKHIVAGTEETTTGVIRLRSMEREGVLRYPIFAVNDADTKHLFDNHYGTGQSTMDGIL